MKKRPSWKDRYFTYYDIKNVYKWCSITHRHW